MSDERAPIPMAELDAPALDSETASRLDRIYVELEAAVARLAPVCELSGRCCRFREYGHTLFMTQLEAEFLLSQAPSPTRALDDGSTCPWQDPKGLCTARNARPLGCRVYFCDPRYEGEAEPLTERFLARLRELTTQAGLPWNYAPLHQHLRTAREQGRWVDPTEEIEERERSSGPGPGAPGEEILDTSPSDQYS